MQGLLYRKRARNEATSLLIFWTAAVRKHCSRMFRMPSIMVWIMELEKDIYIDLQALFHR